MKLLSKLNVLFLLPLSISLFGCLPKPQTTASTPIERIPGQTLSMIQHLNITDFHFDRSFYVPQEPVMLSIHIVSQVEQSVSAKIKASIMHLGDTIDQLEKTISLSGGEQDFEVSYMPPPDVPRGYGVDLCVETVKGEILECISTGFDVLNNWTQNPRYGFLTDFFPGRSNFNETTDSLVRYHINGLQFYDWMYRHEQFLTEEEPYIDLLGRNLSRVTVEKLVGAVHEKSIAAMPYTAIYAASTPFFEEHPDWALYQANGKPYLLGKNFLVYMDPRPDSPWVNYLLSQFATVLQEIDFDGIHLDQYGDPKEAYDSKGNKFSLASPLAETINATKDLVLQYRINGAVVFNAVTNWPIETVSKSNQDFIYIEVWSPYTWFDDLHKLITQAQDLSNGKPVILAAYIDPERENNVRLVDATIFASGGGHIELGEINGMLSDPYFPKYGTISPELSETLRRYYDFAVRYQDAIGPRTADGTGAYLNRILINGAYPSPSQLTDKVWPIVRETDRLTAINLINLRGIKSPEWAREVKDPPTKIEQAIVRISEVNRDVNRIWFASPDRDSISLQPIDFTLSGETGGRTLICKVPYLEYWDLIIIEWE